MLADELFDFFDFLWNFSRRADFIDADDGCVLDQVPLSHWRSASTPSSNFTGIRAISTIGEIVRDGGGKSIDEPEIPAPVCQRSQDGDDATLRL